MHVTTVPVIDRIIAENRVRQGSGLAPEAWLEQVRELVTELGHELLMEDVGVDYSAVFDLYVNLRGLVLAPPALYPHVALA